MLILKLKNSKLKLSCTGPGPIRGGHHKRGLEILQYCACWPTPQPSPGRDNMSTQSSLFQCPEFFFQDIVIGDTTIPAGASVMYNTFTLHMDKKHWGDPEIFRQSMSTSKRVVLAIDVLFLGQRDFLMKKGNLNLMRCSNHLVLEGINALENL